MNQLSLFEPMEQPVLTAEELEKTIWYMDNKTMMPYMQDRWFELREAGHHRNARAIAGEHIVRDY